MRWFEIKIVTTSEAVEAVSEILYEAGVTGVVIEDPNDPMFTTRRAGDWDYCDPSVIQFSEDHAVVKGYLQESEELNDQVEMIRQNVHGLEKHQIAFAPGLVVANEIHEEDWANEWRKYYKPKRITDRLTVKPTWEEYTGELGEVIIEMDPGGAFGTGTHETTMMCMQALDKRVTEGCTVYDIGCGSGILGIVAARLGAARVLSVDNDPAAIRATEENAEINGVSDRVKVIHGNLLDQTPGTADIIVANIIADVIIHLSNTIHRFMNEDTVFIASGILTEKRPEVLAAFDKNGLELIDSVEMGEWCALTVKLGLFPERQP